MRLQEVVKVKSLSIVAVSVLAMALIEESDGRMEFLERSAEATEKTVKIIYDGWKKLMETNTQSDERIGSVETRLSSVEFQLEKIAATIERIESNTIPTKPHGKDIAGTSEPRVRDSVNESEDLSLGYRRNSDMFVSRASLLKKIELPTFDGLLPYRWIRNVE